MHPDCFPVFPGLPNLVPALKQKEKEKKMCQVPSVLLIYSWSMIRLPVASPLKKAVPSSPHQKSLTVKSSASPSVSQCLRLLFGGFLFRLEGGRDIDTEAFNVSHSHCESAVVNTTAKEASLSITNSSSMDHGLPCGFW